ncbi:MAG: galactitol-1-phosphate 5-dehydrogenase [Clostridiales bacterium]|jgi:threonine dehydrogenase-like Zn-dependent dehydrogenase|nr:galactitol-1-phosphate 5-dehydrogenase [Clostridiales bacterium]
MKALVLEQYGKFGYRDVEKPPVGDGDVLIRVKAVAICGSDVHGYDGRSGRRKPPLIIGHEASGVVEAAGAGAARFAAGDRVVFNSVLYCGSCHYCRRGMLNMCEQGRTFGVSCDAYRQEGAMCEYIAVPERIVYGIPDSVTFEQAALIEPAAIALHAAGSSEIRVNDTAAIFGAGTIGIMLLKVLRRSGCGRIAVVDIDGSKLELARANGADACVLGGGAAAARELRELSGGLGVDAAFEAVGVNDSFNGAVASLRRGGRLTLLGNVSPLLEFPLQAVVMNELRLAGSYGCSTEYETAIDMLASGRLDVSDCISAVAPLSEGQQWFDRLRAAEKGLLKVVLAP